MNITFVDHLLPKKIVFLMMLFDFHHHHHYKEGIYNLNLLESPLDRPFSVGIHPKEVEKTLDESWKWFTETSLHQHCWTIGEAGLDGIIDTNEDHQESLFEKQILWANEIKKPVTIHCVRRFSHLLKFKKMAHVPLVIHGFNKKKEIAHELFQKGFYLSFGKAALQNVSLKQIIEDFPLEKMFLETDAAEFDIHLLYEKIAFIKNISIDTLQDQILENIEKLIDL